MRRTIELALELARQRPQAPMTPLNRPISPNRRYAVAHTDLATIKRLGKQAGGTVNDTLLAVVAGMLGRYLAAAGPDAYQSDGRPPVALVPVSVRAKDEAGELGQPDLHRVRRPSDLRARPDEADPGDHPADERAEGVRRGPRRQR